MKIKFIKFEPKSETVVAFSCALAVIVLSLVMRLFQSDSISDGIIRIILRDILMILGIGFSFPLYYTIIVKKQNIKVFGITTEKLKLSLLLNVVLGIALLLLFISESTQSLHFSFYHLYATIYIFAAGVFEMIFFYGFLRHYY